MSEDDYPTMKEYYRLREEEYEKSNEECKEMDKKYVEETFKS